MMKRSATRARWRIGVVMIALACAPAWARPGIDESVRKVEALTKELAGAPAARRGDLLQATIKARHELLALGANDDRLATWLLDQGEAVLEIAGRDGAELSVLYGMPTGEQRKRVRTAAVEAAGLAERAEKAAEEAVSRLEAELFGARGDPGRAKEISARIEPRLRVLVDAEQAWRAPMLRARASLVAAAALDGQAGVAEQRRTAKIAAGLLDDMRGPDAGAEAARSLLLATALMLAGDRLEAAHRFAEVEAASMEGMVREQARLGLAGSAVDLIAAREAARLLERGVEESPPPMSLDLLRSEAVARGVLTHAPASGDARAPVQREGLRGMARVVRRSLGDGVDAGFRAMVVEKVSLLTGTGTGAVEMSGMDSAIVYARGMALLGGGGDAEAEDAGAALLSRVADSDGERVVREAALWALGTRAGVEKAGTKRRVDAAAALVRLAKEFPGSPRARAALERAESLLRSPVAQKDAAALVVQRGVIEMLLQSEPAPANAPDLCSLYVANYALDSAMVLNAPELERVLGLVPAREADDAQRRAGDERNAWIVIERALGGAADRESIARAAARWAVERSPAISARARVAWAGALLDKGEAHASIEQISAIGALDAAALNDAERVQARLILGRAQRATGDEATAFATLRALADDLDRDPATGTGAPKRPEAFWAAWAEMLEVLDGQNATGERTPTIRLQLNRLKLIDAGLGGEPWRSRIERVSKSLK